VWLLLLLRLNRTWVPRRRANKEYGALDGFLGQRVPDFYVTPAKTELVSTEARGGAWRCGSHTLVTQPPHGAVPVANGSVH
jgi:hypothetical protein